MNIKNILKIINKITKFYYGNNFKIKTSISEDEEFHEIKQIVISVFIKETDFEKILQFWENLLNQVRLKINIDKRMAIEVNNIEDYNL